MSVIGDRMRQLRGPSSLREMADAIGIKYSAWARYENGDVLPGAEIITKICQAHAVSADWLLGLDKRSDRQNVSVQTGAGGVSIGCGSGNVVRGTIVAGGDYGNAAACAKCPFKKKLRALEKLIQK